MYRQHGAFSDIIKKQSTDSLPVQISDSLLQQKIVKRFAGLLLNASLPQTENEPYSAQGNMYTSLNSILRLPEKLKSVHNMNIIFRGDFPSDKSSVTLQALYENVRNKNAESDSKPNFSTSKQKSNRNSVKGSNSINMEWNVLLNEDKTPKLSAHLNYSWSEFSNNTKCFFSIYEATKAKPSHLSPMITFKFDGAWAKAPLFDFSNSILNNPQSEFKTTLFRGSSEKPIAIAECKLQRSAERKNYLLEQAETKSCQKEMEDGNYMLPSCQIASQDANYFDQHNCSIKVEHLNEMNKELMLALNFIHMYHNSFFYYPRRQSDHENQISLFTQFAPNFESANVSILFPNIEAKLNNVRIHSLLRSVVKIHPTETAMTRTTQSLLGNQYNPTCVLDKTKLNTFDNRTYSIKFGSCWFVLMALTYQSVADPKLSKNNILVLIRDVDEGRVMRIMVGNDVVDITTQELNKQNSYKYIYVNDKQYSVPKNEITKIALNKQNNNEKLLTTVVDEIIKLQFTNISIVFDGIRVQLMIGNKYRNQVLGLCGTFTGEEHDDFLLPTNCNIIDSKQFIASYAILNNSTCTEEDLEWAKIGMNKSCSLTGDTLIHSEFPKTASCHNDQNKVSDPRCMSRYNQVLQQEKLTCFSQRALTKCKPSCYPTKIVKKYVKFHCVETSVLSKHFVEIIKSGKVHDFSKKPTTKNITVDIPAGCYKC
ncbi:Vitellogenin-2 [Gryllus bimaculatus]|nr:Vitellogenin-2 [Gryllus bimaculatus]